MKTVDIRDVAANLDRLVEQAEKGKPFTISVDGRPLVKVSHISGKELAELPAPEDTPSGQSAGEQDPLLVPRRAGRSRVGTKGLRGWGSWLAARS